ncbi:MAG: hydantoinase B/oxoprolinase family protein [Phycisphaerales bacterium]|nr:hydantoinase B/oxoprolinase family protein [Phycisphaerales bacterium]
MGWQFAIDVGGTFTDVLARSPEGVVRVHKLLSSGRCIGSTGAGSSASALVDPQRRHDPPDFWRGYRLDLHGAAGTAVHSAAVVAFDAATGTLRFAPAAPQAPVVGQRYVLHSSEPAPILAVRYLLGRGLEAPLGEVDLRLGTTRATNALLERKGARTVFVTTRGFADILRIANQDRPRLFDLEIIKPEQLAAQVIELDERLAADGTVLRTLDPDAVRAALQAIPDRENCALAICLLHAHTNSVHEELTAGIAAELGFLQVSVSSRTAPLPRIVARGDTTVVDAYLGPVIRDYVASIKAALPEGQVRVMTSAGGLVDGARVAAKDTLLSGPAGGVVGCVEVARRAGLERVIGFDMGGTSTDVSRWSGAFEYQFETTKGGVRVVAPMLAVETVAAGGGSIAAFDGQKFTVGPHSAGAAPGPACYGAGGPLTVTDANLALGRLYAPRFPFPLDTEAVAARLAELGREAAAGTGQHLSAAALAAGLIRIANEHMAAALRRISVEKGYDPADHALVAFGGAGGQHACAVADLLGIRRVLLSPLAGVLSAWGIAAADVKRFDVRAVDAVLSPEALRAHEPVFAEMETQLAAEIETDGVAPADIEPAIRSCDLRYRGEDAVLTVTTPDGNYAATFERMHEQLYGYVHANRKIELTALRVERVGKTRSMEVAPPASAAAALQPVQQTRTYFADRWWDTPVFDRSAMRIGHRVAGPALILENTGTIVVPPDWGGAIVATGDLLLERGDATSRRQNASTACDPVRLELFNNRFAAIAEQMGTTLRRTALSTNVKERLDYSCAVFDATGELIANAPHLPVHLGSMGACVQAVLRESPQLAPGDVVLNNDPFSGGTHIPDVTCVAPVFAPDGTRLLFLVASRAHHAEIGGSRPGSLPADATTLAEEGVLIRHFKVVSGGELQTAALRTMLTGGPYPSRAPEENIADIAAQIAANQTGIRALHAFLAEAGEPVVLAYMQHIRGAAEAKMRAALRRLGDGTYTFADALDDGSPICCRIDVRDGTARLDFAGSAGVHPGNFNANPAIVASAVLYCFRCLLAEDIPLNAGVLAPLEIVVPRGMLDPPRDDDPLRCPAVGAGNVETSQRLVDVIFGALGAVAASQGTMNNVIFGDAGWGYYETIAGGSGAGPTCCGADAVHTHMTNTRQTDPEVLEARYPVRLRRLAIRCGSGGAGRQRGGDGLIREIEFLAPVTLSIISQRRVRAPYGVAGGSPGACGVNRMRRAGRDVWEVLPGVVSTCAETGDTLRIETPGGGGYGRPQA